jgi:hypothetical protein
VKGQIGSTTEANNKIHEKIRLIKDMQMTNLQYCKLLERKIREVEIQLSGFD